MAYGLQLSDGRIADPFRLLTSNIFDLGDLAANFGDDVGSRRMFQNGSQNKRCQPSDFVQTAAS